MKAMKYMMLFVVCMTMASCGGDSGKLDAYRTKVIEHVAAMVKTTPEMLVKDLDLKIDSMSLSFFLVEDSLALVQKQHDDFMTEKESHLASAQKSVSKLEEELKTAKGISKYATASTLDNFKRIHHNIGVELKRGKDKYEKIFATFQNRDMKEVIYSVFQYRITLKNPLTGVHMVEPDMVFFTPDGQTILKDVDKAIRLYINNKEKGKNEENN